jgi:hypothetical protein
MTGYELDGWDLMCRGHADCETGNFWLFANTCCRLHWGGIKKISWKKVRFQVLTAASMKFRVSIALMMEAVHTYETSVNFNMTTWRYIPETKLQVERSIPLLPPSIVFTVQGFTFEWTRHKAARQHQSWQRQSLKIGNRSFESVAKFKYLATTLTDQDCIHEEIKSRLNSENACYHSVQSLLSSRLLSRKSKVKIYKTIILPVVLYGCETWSLTLREDHRLRVFEKRVLRRKFGPKKHEMTGEWRTLHSEEPHNLYSSRDIIRQVKFCHSMVTRPADKRNN